MHARAVYNRVALGERPGHNSPHFRKLALEDYVNKKITCARTHRKPRTQKPTLGALSRLRRLSPGMVPDDGLNADGFASCMNINFRGVVRTTEAFLPLLEPSKGRVVITSSASGPMFVAKCSPERQALMVDPAVTRAQIDGLLEECQGIASSGGSMEEKFAAAGLKGVEGTMGVYGLSKARTPVVYFHLVRFLGSPHHGFRRGDPKRIRMHVLLFQQHANLDYVEQGWFGSFCERCKEQSAHV